MDVLLIHEYRFYQTPDGKVWTPNVWDYSSRQHYLSVFGHVTIAAKITPVYAIPGNWNRADSNEISFYPFPYYSGMMGFFANYRKLRRSARSLLNSEYAVIINAPSILSTLFMPSLYRSGRPYAIEVHTDPYYFYSPGARQHPLRPFLRYYFFHYLRRQCRQAAAVTYETEQSLQDRYPTE